MNHTMEADQIPHSAKKEESFSTFSEEPRQVINGGRKAWCTLVGGFLVVFVCSGYINAFGVYQDVYTRNGTGTAAQISWIGSLQFFLSYALGYPVGLLMDKGYFSYVNWIGVFIFSFSLFMASLAHNGQYYQTLLSMGLGVGIGVSLLYMPAVAIQAHHWDKRRALAMGVVGSGGAIGGVVYAIMLNELLASSISFEWSIRIPAFMSVGILVVGASLMSTNPDHVNSNDGASANLKKIVFDASFLLSSLGVLVLFLGIFIPYFYLQLFSILHGVDPSIAFHGLAIMLAASIVGRITICALADSIGTFNSTIPSAAVCAALVFAMLGIKSSATSIVFAIIYGIFSGGVLGLVGPLFASLARSPGEVGATVGVAFTICSLGALVGPPVDGALLTHEYHWSKPILFSGITCFVGVGLLVASRQVLAKKRATMWL